jgi:polysaccharide export outer membrane protein
MKKKRTALLLLTVLFGLSFPALCPAQSDGPGFGLQPGLIPPVGDPKTLVKRIMSSTEYKLTPGDTYELVINIEETERFPLLLSDSYELDIPFLGTVNVRDMFFADLKKMVVRNIKAKIPVQYVDFVLTSPALFDIFVYGGVTNPGIATVNPLSRVSDAILLAKGPVKGASYRRVDLIRDGRTRTLDLSMFAAQGDYEQNPVLEPGDKIFVNAAEKLVEISGKVRYPGPFELLPEDTLNTLLDLAGGITPDARTETIRIARLDERGKVQILDIPFDQAGETRLTNGDRIAVSSSLENEDTITIDAAVYGQPTSGEGPIMIPPRNVVVTLPYIPGLGVLDILEQLGGPSPLADTAASYVQRQKDRLPVDVGQLWTERQQQYDLALEPGDLLVIPMQKLKVFVAGEVNSPGALPYVNGYKVADYILAAGGISLETGDRNKIFFMDALGNRDRTALDIAVTEPGTLIYVAKSGWGLTQKSFKDVLIITAFIGALVGLTNNVIDLIQEF